MGEGIAWWELFGERTKGRGMLQRLPRRGNPFSPQKLLCSVTLQAG